MLRMNESELPEGFHLTPIAPAPTTSELDRAKAYLKRMKKKMSIYEIKIQCCVCKKWLGTKPTDREDQHGEVSHTYCPACQEEVMREIDNM